jgi:ribonucleoside-diphosphate reductase subunit M1
MYVVKRDGKQAPVNFDEILNRITECSKGLDEVVNPVVMAQKVVSGVYRGVTTRELDELAARKLMTCFHTFSFF